MKNIPILGKVLGIVAVFALFVIGATAFTTSKMRVIDTTYSDLSDRNGAANILLARSSRAVWGMRASIVELLIANTDERNSAASQNFKQQYSDFSSYMDRAAALLPDHGSKFAGLKQKTLAAVDQTCSETIKLGQATDQDGIIKAQSVFLKDCVPALGAVTSELRAAVDDLLNETKVINDATTDVTNGTIQTTWALILSGLVLVLAGAYFATRLWISKPLTALAATMSAIAGGDYRIVIAGAERKDEVGVMARVAEIFKRTGEEKVTLEAEAAKQRHAAEDKREQEEAARKHSADQQAQVVTGLATGLSQLAAGDLAFRLEQPFASDYEKLRFDFNAAIAKLQEAMTVITGTTSAIRSGTVEISTAAEDLSRRTEQQAASLEETAAALDEITATVKKTASGAMHASTVVSTAKGDAEQSGLVVGRAVEAMTAIETSSQKIGQIIGVIDEIAFQTNLLALNAGVEAARAGEAGRGFAVVASEVRALAQRSAEAAKEIKALISTSASQVGDGVELVDATGKALGRIVDQVAQISLIVTEIAASAQEQSAALEQVNTAINQMDQVTQQNAAMVEETTAASRNLAGETDELSRLVGQFRVGQTTASSRPVTRHHAPAQPVPAMKVTGRGGAAPKTVPQDAGWEEF